MLIYCVKLDHALYSISYGIPVKEFLLQNLCGQQSGISEASPLNATVLQSQCSKNGHGLLAHKRQSIHQKVPIPVYW